MIEAGVGDPGSTVRSRLSSCPKPSSTVSPVSVMDVFLRLSAVDAAKPFSKVVEESPKPWPSILRDFSRVSLARADRSGPGVTPDVNAQCLDVGNPFHQLQRVNAGQVVHGPGGDRRRP